MSDRRPLDAYYTPDDLAAKLVEILPLGPGVRVWEPHAGGGAFARALLERECEVFATDISPGAPEMAAHPRLTTSPWVWDALHGWPIDWIGLDPPAWVIGNPPFQGFESHVNIALSVAPNVAFLLRLAAMESAGRIECWRRWPLHKVWVLAERPSFTGGGTDSAAYGFFWFQRGYRGAALVVPGWSWKGGRDV